MHCMRNEMPQTVTQLRDRLLQIINTNGTISNEAAALEVIAMLENTQISCEDLEETRIGKYINTVRKAASDAGIQKRAKKLIKAWQQMIEPTKTIKTEAIVKKEVSRNPSPQEQPKRSQNKQVSSKRDIPKREPPKQIPLQRDPPNHGQTKQDPSKRESQKRDPLKRDLPKQNTLKRDQPKQDPLKQNTPKQNTPKQNTSKRDLLNRDPSKRNAPKQGPPHGPSPTVNGEKHNSSRNNSPAGISETNKNSRNNSSPTASDTTPSNFTCMTNGLKVKFSTLSPNPASLNIPTKHPAKRKRPDNPSPPNHIKTEVVKDKIFKLSSKNEEKGADLIHNAKDVTASAESDTSSKLDTGGIPRGIDTNNCESVTSGERPGIDGCRATNGSWYAWKEGISIQRDDLFNSDEQDDILTILPYIELD